MRRPSKLASAWQTPASSLTRQAERAKRRANAARDDRYARWHVAAVVEREADGWLLSYLDLLSLLLVMFATLWAVSNKVSANTEENEALAPLPEASVAVTLVTTLARNDLNPIAEPDLSAYASPPLPPAPATPAPTTQPAPPTLVELGLDELGPDIDVIVNEEAVRFRINSEVLFAPGQAELTASGEAVLERLVQVLLRDDYPISVEGHSDSVPIKNKAFPSNWELSSSRATRVLRHLVYSGIAAQRLRATGYADTHPLASNATAAGRASNRRVELVVPMLGLKVQH